MNKAFVVIFLFFSCPKKIYTFNSLQDLLAYAKKVDELPDSDLDRKGVLAQVNPTFNQFYPTIDPGFLGRVLCRFNIFKPLWCFSDFMSVAQQIYEQETGRSWHSQSKILGSELQSATVIGCTATQGLTLIIVGELSGAFHSLVRIIEDWHAKNIIDKELRLINDKKHYIVFLGNVIGTSAYNLETLTAVGTLMRKNPNNVWYLCGNYEERQRWHENPLYHAITVRSRLPRIDKRATYQLMDNIFAMLPKALVITSVSQKEIIMCASPQLFDEININDVYGCVKTFTHQEIVGCALNGKARENPKDINLLALLETRRSWTTAFIQPPLEKIELPAVKATIWDLVSGTTRALLSSYLFRWNGYFVLTPLGEHLEKSTLEYIGRRIDSEDSFKNRGIYNVVTGLPYVALAK